MKLEKPLNLDDAEPGLLVKVASEQGEKVVTIWVRWLPARARNQTKPLAVSAKNS